MSTDKLLIIADSALELILSIQIKLSLYKNVYGTLIMTDRTMGSYEVYKRFKDLNIFDELLYIEANQFPGFSKTRYLPNYISNFVFDYRSTKTAKRLLRNPDSYTIFLSSEIDYFSRYMYMAVKRNASPYLISEGILAFAGLRDNIESAYNERNAVMLRELRGLLYYGPQLDNLPFENTIKIPSINNNRNELIDVLNYIFDYQPHKKIYRNKIIFFEESYSREGGHDNAVEILELLVNEYGKDKVVVKRHPRDIDNRFCEMGISSIEPFWIPWEIIILNGDCENSILVSANSGSVYLCKIWDFCEKEMDFIMLNKFMNYMYPNVPYVHKYMKFLEKLYVLQGMNTPKTKEELIKCIKQSRVFEGSDYYEKK